VRAIAGGRRPTRLKEEQPDLVVTDFMMPIGDGRELILEMRALPEHRSTPVLMVTATTRAIVLSDAQGTVDVSALLRKPFRWEGSGMLSRA